MKGRIMPDNQWLLTQTEIAKAIRDSENSPLLPSDYIAQAQLRKVAEQLKPCAASRTNTVEHISFRQVLFFEDDWQALLTEAGIEA